MSVTSSIVDKDGRFLYLDMGYVRCRCCNGSVRDPEACKENGWTVAKFKHADGCPAKRALWIGRQFGVPYDMLNADMTDFRDPELK